MKKYNLKDFIGGWFIGDFEPNLVRTKDFEVSVKYYKKGDKDKAHTHKVADEFTVITKGSCSINGKVYKEGEIIWIKPNDVSEFEALEDSCTTIVKIPSVMGDKYEV
jgi:quercetin dioxygenase-like cupin family protein